MTAVLLLVRVVLAAVFAVAGVAKLLDRKGTRTAARGLGVPERLSGPVAVGLPPLELATAAALLPGASARWAAAAAAALLALFAGAIAAALARGEHVACHCFGGAGATAVGRLSLVRNGVLLVLAALAVAVPGPGLAAWLGTRSDAALVAVWLGAALVAVVAAAVWFGLALLGQQGRLLLRLEALETPASAVAGLPLGTPAPEIETRAWPDGALSLDTLLDDALPVALVFSDARCKPCADAVPALAAAQRRLLGRITVAVISNGASPESETGWLEHGLERVGIVDGPGAMLSYGIGGSPAAVLVSREGIVASKPAVGLAAIEELFRLAAEVDRVPA